MIKNTIALAIGAMAGLLYEFISINLFSWPLSMLTQIISLLTSPGWFICYEFWNRKVGLYQSNAEAASYATFVVIGALFGFIIYKMMIKIKKAK